MVKQMASIQTAQTDSNKNNPTFQLCAGEVQFYIHLEMFLLYSHGDILNNHHFPTNVSSSY